MDGEFRDAFFQDPAVASEAEGIPLTGGERSALTRSRPGALAAFQRYLDAKHVTLFRGATAVFSRHDRK